MSFNSIKTKSFCPLCLRTIDASNIEKEGRIYLQKNCPDHGEFEYLHKWRDSRYYNLIYDLGEKTKRAHSAGLLIDLNYDCNQNCSFCFAEANQRNQKPISIQEIISKVKNFKGIYVYLCGGEPTLRQDIFLIIQEIKRLGFRIILMTNGKKLVGLDYVQALERAGLDVIQLQFDSFEDSHYAFLRNEKLLEIKLKAIENIKKTKMRIYLHTALVKGINDNQISRIIDFAAKNSRIIEVVYLVPVWPEGRVKKHDSLSLQEITSIIGQEYGITQEDFMDYTIFDYYSSAIWQQLTKSALLKFVPCTLNCFFFNSNGSSQPLSKLINLKEVNYRLKKSYDLFKAKNALRKISGFFNLWLLLPKFLMNRKTRAFILDIIHNLISFLFFKSSPAKRDNYSFQVRIESFFSRYDADFKMMEQCNLHAYFKDELVPFCQQEIMRRSSLKEDTRDG